MVSTEFDYLTGSELTGAINRASGWLSANVGVLNTHLFTEFSGENPDLGLEEQAIFKSLYLENFYTVMANAAIRGVGSSTLEWLSMREGDSSITQQNKNEVARTWRGLAKDARERANNLIQGYNLFQSTARQVDVNLVTTGSNAYYGD